MVALPIDAHLPEITARLRESRAAVIVAEPGAGKTTRVPPAILAANLLSPQHPKLVMLQPRRVAARAAASRIADERGWRVGDDHVGYHVRFDRKLTPRTKLRVLTEGILTRQLVDDPFLEGVGGVILDEFHERSLNTDIAIALLREVRQTVRQDLMLVVMSATLHAEPVSEFLGNCPIVRVPGRTFPVTITYGKSVISDIPEGTAGAIIARARETASGDTLVFLPGVDEIRRTARAIESLDDFAILPLHGSLSSDEQFAALKPSRKRKIVLATNIAETSLTIDGVTHVIDTGLARVAGFDAERGLDRLDLKRISRASADQRAGRAGRTAPGTCLRLWSEKEHHALADFELPEIKRVDLAGTVLALHAWGKSDPRAFGWFEAPPDETLASAERLLAMLGALSTDSKGSITELGRRLLSIPAHPRIARLLIASGDSGLLREGAALAAMLSERDFLIDPPKVIADSDLLVRLEMLEHDRRDARVDSMLVRQVAHTAAELTRIVRLYPSPGTPGEGRGEGSSTNRKDSKSRKNPHPNPLPDYRERGQEQQLRRDVLLAYPDRVCRRRGSDPNLAVMVGGGGVRVARESAVSKAEYFLALDARTDQRSASRESLVRLASAIDPQWLEELFPRAIRKVRELYFDESRQRVVARGQIYYLDLLLREDQDAPVDPQEAGNVLAEALRPRARSIFESDAACANWLNRLSLLRDAMPEQDWPAIDDAALGDLLAGACAGKRSLDEIRRAGSLVQILQGSLHYPLDRIFQAEAPETIEVPTGNRIGLGYAGGRTVKLAVRLQELFGLAQTPRIAGGRVPVVLELLGPNFRPVQVTDDLASFWKNTYPQVRKDLRARYPKHSWPDDPLTAPPQAKGGRRRG